MKFKAQLIAVFLILSSSWIFSQVNDIEARKYIDNYKDIAIAEQIIYNIPASIKLAQGIIESACGSSELALNAANHFGIKCKSKWVGDTYHYDDDAKQECFRKYSTVEESYYDHSIFLTSNERYAPLFDIHPINYKDWAYQLKKCGYATEPKYADRLIKVIEQYDLQSYTLEAIEKKENTADQIIVAQSPKNKNQPSGEVKSSSEDVKFMYASVNNEVQNIPQENRKEDYYTLTKLHGIKGFYAKKGDMLLNAAIKFKVRYATLLKYNDLKDEPLPYDMFIYLDTKRKIGDRPQVTVKSNDNLHLISQQEGIQLALLREMNQLDGLDEPAAGEVIYLQSKIAKKPKLRDPKTLDDVHISVNEDQENSNFIAINQEEDPEEKPEDDGVVKEEEEYEVEEDEVITDYVEEDQDAIVEIEDEETEEEEEDSEEFVVVPENKQKEAADFRTMDEAVIESGKENNNLDELKRKMDRSVYSDANVTPKSEEQKRKEMFDAGSHNTKKENVIPKNNAELNRHPKQNLSYADKVDNEVAESGDMNAKLVSHMKLVRNGMFPRYQPKSTGVEHTAAPAPPMKKVTPKKKSTKKVDPKKSTTKKKPVANKKAPTKKNPAQTKKTTKKPTKKATPTKKTTKKKK